jgi:predicted amidohydrolase
VLKEFLEEHASDLLNMLYGWKAKEAREVEIEEAREEGIVIGKAEGKEKLIQTARAMLDKGMSYDLVSDLTGLRKDEIGDI